MEAPELSRASLRNFLNAVFKRKLQILLFFIVTFSFVAVGTFLTTPTYEANAQILVKRGIEGIYVPAKGSPSPVLSINREAQINTEIAILKSRSLAKKVVEALGSATIYPKIYSHNRSILSSIFGGSGDKKSPAEKVRMTLQKKLVVGANNKSNIITVSFKHTDPAIATGVIKILTDLYLDRHMDLYRENYKLLVTKFEESRIADPNYPEKIASVSLVEPVQVPLKPVSPRVMLNLVLGLLIGALGGLGLAFFLHYMDDSFETVEDVEAALKVPVLISVLDSKKEAA